MDNLKNEIYENLGLSEDIQERIVDAMENAAKSNITPDTDNIRRKNSMKKNTHSDILNKVAVASLSLGLSGALIAGIITYTKETSTVKTGVAKETMTTTNIINAESKPDEFYNSINDINEYSTSKTFKRIFFIDPTGDIRRAKVGNNTIELTEEEITEDNLRVNVSIKQGNGKLVNVDKIDNAEKYNLSFSAYGNAIYYCDGKGLKKLDLKSLKAEYIINFSDVDIATPNQETFAINDNYIYMSGKTGRPEAPKSTGLWSPEVDYMYSYNLRTKKFKLLENKKYSATINDTYYITSEYAGTIWNRNYYLEKIEDGKVTTIKKFKKGDNVYFDHSTNSSYTTPAGATDTFFDGITINIGHFPKDGIMISEADKEVFYYTTHKSNKDDNEEFSEFTIMSYNLSTNKEEEIATVTAHDLNDSDNNFNIVKITDDYCEINHSPNDFDSTDKSRYYFKTGKVEKLN